MKPYGDVPNALLNIREAAIHPWMGLTGLLAGRPYLVIGKEGNKFILEGEDGDIQKLLQFEWKDATDDSRLIAASRQEGSALTKGSVLGGYTVGNIRHHEGQWYIMRDDGENVLPFHAILAKLDDIRYDPLKLTWDIRAALDAKKGISYDADYRCPECKSTNTELDDDEGYCQDCGFIGSTTEDFLNEPPDVGGDPEYMDTPGGSLDWYPGFQHNEARVAGDAESVVASTVENGGGTYDPISLDEFQPTSGYFASKTGFQVEADEFTPEFMANALQTMELTPGEYIGTWVDGGTIYVDPARWFEDQDVALQFAAQNGQQAIWDVANNVAVDVPQREAKTASTFEMNLPPQGIHFRTHGAIREAGLTCTVHYPPIPAYPDGLVGQIPGNTAIDEMDYSDEIEMAGGQIQDVVVQVNAPDGTEDQVREIINQLGGVNVGVGPEVYKQFGEQFGRE